MKLEHKFEFGFNHKLANDLNFQIDLTLSNRRRLNPRVGSLTDLSEKTIHEECRKDTQHRQAEGKFLRAEIESVAPWLRGMPESPEA